MKNSASVVGWFLLAAVLAVPSFLFYNWWSKNKEKAALERVQTVNSGNVFPSSEKISYAQKAGFPVSAVQSNTTADDKGNRNAANDSSEKVSGTLKQAGGSVSGVKDGQTPHFGPSGKSTSQAGDGVTATDNKWSPAKFGPHGDGSSGGEPEADRPQAVGTAQPASVPAQNAGAATTVSAQVALSSAIPAAAQGSATAAVAISTQTKLISYFKPKYDRDPTISPLEYRQRKEEEEQRAAEERRRLAESKRHIRETGIESKLRLQGIVGNSVIINGDMYNAGQMVLGAKILKVGTDYFVGEYKGKQFRKVLK